MDWINLTENNLASACGPDASFLLLHHRKALDTLLSDLQRSDSVNTKWRELYGADAVQYVRNSHFLFDRDGVVRAAGSREHVERYFKPGYIIVIRESLVGCTCENNGDYCASCQGATQLQ